MSAAHEQQPDRYAWWRQALAGGVVGSATLPVHEGDPQAGFWRKRTERAGPFVPCAIWHDGVEYVALVEGRRVDAAELWSFVCRYPISEEVYHARMRGEPWPDEDSGTVASLAPQSIGSNNPPQDEADILAAQIEAASANAKAYETITDDATASKAQSARARLNELSREADRKREKIKAPHLEAGKSIDAKWNPLVKAAKAAADAIARALSAHETRKAREAADAARKAAEAEAERQRALRETLAKHPEAPPEFIAPVAPPQPVEAPKAQIRAAYGRAATVKAVKIAHVKDYNTAVTYFIDNTEFRAVIDKLAQRAVDAGITVPGVEVEEQRKVT